MLVSGFWFLVNGIWLLAPGTWLSLSSELIATFDFELKTGSSEASELAASGKLLLADVDRPSET